MTFSYEDLLSPEEILADILTNIDDREMRELSPGWYKRQIRVGLETLNYQSPFIECYKDIAMNDTLIFSMPKGGWNIKDVFLWSGDDCVIESSVRVMSKDNFITKGYGTGYTARVKTNQPDLFTCNPTIDSGLFFYYASAGQIYLSDYCKNYSYVRIVYYGMPTENIDKIRFIPPFCREALTGYVTERAFFALKGRDPKYRIMWADAKADLYSPQGRFSYSKWDECLSKMKMIDKKVMSDLGEYLSKMNY